MRTRISHGADMAVRHERRTWMFAYLVVVGGGLLIALFVRNRTWQPYLGVTLALLVLLVTAWLARPRVALYVTVFLTTFADGETANWFPFSKNLSSRESIAFVSDAATISPLEISLLIGVVTSTLRLYSSTGLLLPRNPMVRPVLAFLGFLVFGFVHGVLTGGDPVIAVFESRGPFYVVAMFLIASNECHELRHFRHLLTVVLVGIVGHALISLAYFASLSPESRSQLESLAEHGASTTMNILFLVLIAALCFRALPRHAVIALSVGAIPVLVVYLIAQRRSAIAALSVAMIAMFMVLFWRRRRTFWRAVPLVAIVTVGYLGAFWSSTSTLGFPAQALKGVIAPSQVQEEDAGSDQYRVSENFNVNYTIRSSPITGLGFGHEFLRPIPLPRIEEFVLARYHPHNSFLWIWIKLGFFGFVSMIYVLAKAVMLGTERLRRLPIGVDLIVGLIAVLWVLMFAVFTYVDISWDPRLSQILGVSLAVCAQPVAARTPRPEVAEPGTELVPVAARLDA